MATFLMRDKTLGSSGRQKNGIIICDPRLTVVDFQTEYKLTEEEIKALPYAEGVVNDGVFLHSIRTN